MVWVRVAACAHTAHGAAGEAVEKVLAREERLQLRLRQRAPPVLRDQPRLKAREEHRRGRAAEEAADRKHPVELKVLGDAGEGVGAAVCDEDHLLAPEGVRRRPDERARQPRRPEAEHE